MASFDEKTGMQATERIAPDLLMKPGRPVRLEFEYRRHGTLTLLAMLLVNTGVVLAAHREERGNQTTAELFTQFCQCLFQAGYETVHVVLDQLNTHWSLEMVHAVAVLSGVPMPDPEQIRTGEQRRQWLSRTDRRVVLHYTPRHASWLNPIEVWFGVLSRKVLRRGSFKSTTDLAERVERFIDYYNEMLAKPYKLRAWEAAA